MQNDIVRTRRKTYNSWACGRFCASVRKPIVKYFQMLTEVANNCS
jgi:hypothetical protein